ncbi:MAG: hypothetical protein WD049_02305 [Candidatus Paceibacterota bacterium]
MRQALQVLLITLCSVAATSAVGAEPAPRRWAAIWIRGRMLLARVAIVAICFACSTTATADIIVRPVEHHTNEFGGREISRGFRVESDQPLVGRFVWSLSAQDRTLARGEQELRVTEQAADVTIKFRLNALRDEVVLPITLTVAVVVEQDEVSRQELRLWLFPDDPFGPRDEWLRSLDITLFDPVENTSQRFDDSHLPYRSTHNLAAIHDPEQPGILVIGEGVSLRKHRSLAETVLQAAASGRRVLLLAPADGSLTVPGTARDGLPDGGAPGELRFARQHIISELDKRLDALAWQGTNNAVPASKFLIESRHNRVEATVSDESRAWPWLEVRYPESGGALVLCGFRVIEHWNSGPTPRFLLLRLLEHLSPPASDN